MDDLGEAFLIALQLIAVGDRELFRTVELSLRVSLTASGLAFVLGAPLGTFLAIQSFPHDQFCSSCRMRCSACPRWS